MKLAEGISFPPIAGPLWVQPNHQFGPQWQQCLGDALRLERLSVLPLLNLEQLPASSVPTSGPQTACRICCHSVRAWSRSQYLLPPWQEPHWFLASTSTAARPRATSIIYHFVSGPMWLPTSTAKVGPWKAPGICYSPGRAQSSFWCLPQMGSRTPSVLSNTAAEARLGAFPMHIPCF